MKERFVEIRTGMVLIQPIAKWDINRALWREDVSFGWL
jgi:hypothetical protein